MTTETDTTDDAAKTKTVCEKCGVQFGAPHIWSDDDCVLDHIDHVDRYVGLLCRRHYHWIDSTLDQILELFTLMSPMPHMGQSDRRSAEVDAPAPGSLDVLALLDDRSHRPRRDEKKTAEVLGLHQGLALGPEFPNIITVLGGWACAVIEERGLDEDGFLPLTGIMRLLKTHRHWIARQPWIDDYTIELNDIHLAMARGARDTKWPAPIGKCPNCTTSLYNTIGVDEVTCRKCGTVWSGIALARLRLIMEQEKAAG